MEITITPSIRIPESELELSYARSSGPGGQNVNKVNSKAVLRWNLAASPSLSEPARALLRARLSSQLTREGELVIASDRFRDQLRNREDCIQKLIALVAAAAFTPKARKKTRPTKASERKRSEAKSRQSRKKSLRKAPRFGE